MAAKKRSENPFIQEDNRLQILKRFNIPASSADTHEALGAPVTLLWNTTLQKLRIYNGTSWVDASIVDLLTYYNKAEVDALIAGLVSVNNAQQVDIDNLLGLSLVSEPLSQELKLVNGDGDTISTISVAFLNNEGTTFIYNETTGKLELWNDNGEKLSEIPVSAFVENLPSELAFNSSVTYNLELRDDTGVVVSSVAINISNVNGLAAALSGKEPSFTILPVSKGGTGKSSIGDNNFIIGSGGAYVEKTPSEVRGLIGAQETGDYLTEEDVPLHVREITEEDIENWNDNTDVALGPETNGLTFVDGLLELHIATITTAGAMSAADKAKLDTLFKEYIENGPYTEDNQIFVTTHNFISGTTKVYRNGIRQFLGEDYAEVSSSTIVFGETLLSSEFVIIEYKSTTL